MFLIAFIQYIIFAMILQCLSTLKAYRIFPGGPWAHRRPTPGRFPRLAICQPEPGPVCGEHMRPQAGGRGGRKARAVRADQPGYRSERDPAAPDMRRTSRRGSGAPRRRCVRTDSADRGSEEDRLARAPAPEPAERDSGEGRKGLSGATGYRMFGAAWERAEGGEAAARSPAAKCSGGGTDQPSYRSERDPAAPDMRHTSRRGSGAPRRRWAAQTARRGAPRKLGPCRLPDRAAGQESLRHAHAGKRRAAPAAGPSWRQGRGARDSGGATAGEAVYGSMLLRIMQIAALQP